MRYGLIGKSLGHSHSAAIHAQLGGYPYAHYEIDEDALADFLRQPGFGGFNVTIPYKERALALCDDLSPEAARIGSVNTVVVGADGRLRGHNTDWAGMVEMAQQAGIVLAGRKVLILGSGGTSRTARQVAADLGAREVVVVSRRGPVHYGNLEGQADAQVIIQTTPVGMMPDLAGQPVDLAAFPALEGVLDVVYNPLRTRLLQQAAQLGIPAVGGLSMLVWQAAHAAALFTGHEIAAEMAEAALRRTRRQVENIVLVGMPGCGKTAIGRRVAAQLGRPFLDTDEMIETHAGMPIPAIFAQVGEAAFREVEREAILTASRRSGVVIATGGGSVLDGENRTLLRQNGQVFWLKRPLAMLATEGRPLSKNLEEMARVRALLYQSVSDAQVDNDRAIDDVAARVLEVFG